MTGPPSDPGRILLWLMVIIVFLVLLAILLNLADVTF